MEQKEALALEEAAVKATTEMAPQEMEQQSALAGGEAAPEHKYLRAAVNLNDCWQCPICQQPEIWNQVEKCPACGEGRRPPRCAFKSEVR